MKVSALSLGVTLLGVTLTLACAPTSTSPDEAVAATAGSETRDGRNIVIVIVMGMIHGEHRTSERHFNDDLGLGGWQNINRAHYALIEQALDAHRGEGKTLLITFGAWHRYWFLEQLRQRDDIVLREPEELLEP